MKRLSARLLKFGFGRSKSIIGRRREHRCKRRLAAGVWSLIALFTFFVLSDTHVYASCPPGNTIQDIRPPTDIKRTYVRKGSGEWGAPRSNGAKHSGTDIIITQSSADKSAYAVYAMASGKIAYARFNGEALDKGYGNIIVIDHGNDCYSLYAHLAGDPFTPLSSDLSRALLVEVGQDVQAGDLIGYFVDQDKGVDSTGNAMRTAAGARWQTHVAFIEASSGRSGDGSFKDIFLSNGGKLVSAQPLLEDLGYQIKEAP
jgi:hypothetical protein